MMRVNGKNPETILTATIRDVLRLAGIPHSKILQGLGAERGIADLIGCLPSEGGRMLAVEVKMPRGRLSDYQEKWLGRMEAGGAKILVARSVEDVVEGLNLGNVRLA